MMKTSHLILLALVLEAGTVVAQYQWACTESDGAGQRYVPSVRNRDVLTTATSANEINIYEVDALNEACSGEVTAIEYCYRYDVIGAGAAVFRWTVLILEDTGAGNFRITNSYTIESHLNSSSSVNCSAASSGRKDCCDVDQINGFNLPDNFVFGVTGPSQGNTHSATLLGFHDTVTQYVVNTTQLARAGLSLSEGSTVPSTPVTQRGLRMLWFVIVPKDLPSPTTDPVTEAPATTESEIITGNIGTTSLAPTPTYVHTEASTDLNLTTEPSSVTISDDIRGQANNIIVIVIVVVLLGTIVAAIVSIIIACTIPKKRGKAFAVTRANLHIRNSNVQNPDMNNVNDYVDENLTLVSERAVINENYKDHETAFYYSGASNRATTSSPDKSTFPDNSEHIYEVDFELGGAVPDQGYADPTYTSPQFPLAYEVPQQSSLNDVGIYMYVPTAAERKSKLKQNTRHQTLIYNKLEFFIEESDYWTPASTTSDLYSQLASKKYREIPREHLTVLKKLGSGKFGQVCKAVWSISGATKELAIKTLRAELPEGEKVRFLQEAAIMGQFSHPNVVKLYGVVTVGEPVMICLEFMANGDLRHYLCSIAPSSLKESASELKLQFLRFSKQIAAGMNYLAKKSFVHRDLAARNVLLDNALICKIGDFGLARDLVFETYYTPSTKGEKLPVKWMAPEVLFYKKYSTDSDVWSYGMVLFEIWSVGKKPFSRFSNNEVVRKVNTGYNQPPPPGCPRAIYQLMVDCWNPVHSKRPSFADIGRYLSTSVDLLLRWVDKNNSISPQVGVLGAPLSEADSLYKDLQNVYADTQ